MSPEKNSSRWLLWVVLTVSVLAVGICLWIFREQDKASEPIPKPTDLVVDAVSSQIAERKSPSTPNREGPKEAEPSPEELKIISKYTATVRGLLNVCEKENTTTVFDREYEGLSHRTILKITPPTGEQLSAVYDEITRGLSELKATSAGEKKFRRVCEAMLRDYMDYPRKVKALSIMTFTDAKKLPHVFEIYANSESEYMPQEDGSFVLPTHQHYRSDEAVGGNESWALTRYGHLIEVSED